MLFLPLLVVIILVIIHVYFGSFVLRRGILFIDIALAQWAALGYLIGTALDITSDLTLFIFAFVFTIIASSILMMLKPIFSETNQQEAIIGILYITATALATGLISSTGMEGHHLKEMLSGHLLFIQSNEVLFAYSLYAIIGIILLKYHSNFIQPTTIKWDFTFYILFGLVVTSSVKLAGVLLVFSYLVIPIITATLLKNTFKERLLIAWFIGITGSILGLILALFLDIAPAYCIIYALVIIWVIQTITYVLKRKKS